MPVIEWLLTGVNMVIEGAMIIAVVSILSVVLVMNSHLAKVEQTNNMLKDYTEYNQYDFTHVYPQDVTAAIMSYRGFPAVQVKCSKSTSPTAGDIWSETRQATPFQAAKINEKIDQNVIYDADIQRNPNGEVITVTFYACDHSPAGSAAGCRGR